MSFSSDFSFKHQSSDLYLEFFSSPLWESALLGRWCIQTRCYIWFSIHFLQIQQTFTSGSEIRIWKMRFEIVKNYLCILSKCLKTWEKLIFLKISFGLLIFKLLLMRKLENLYLSMKFNFNCNCSLKSFSETVSFYQNKLLYFSKILLRSKILFKFISKKLLFLRKNLMTKQWIFTTSHKKIVQFTEK